MLLASLAMSNETFSVIFKHRVRGEIVSKNLAIFVSVQNGFPHGTIRRSNFDGIFCLHSGNIIESQNDVQTQDTQSQMQTGKR